MAGMRIGNHFIGTASINGANMRGEGGPISPYLIVPLDIKIDPRPTNAMITITKLRCSLHQDSSTGNHNLLTPTIELDLSDQFRVRSVPSGSSYDNIELRFPLTLPQLTEIERIRHQADGAAFRATLQLHANIAWIRETGNDSPPNPQTFLGHPFDISYGLFSSLVYFWITSIDKLDVYIPASHWISRVLPGLGIDRLRLIEVAFPDANDLVPQTAIDAFGQAQREFELGNYRSSMQQCRDVRTYIEQHLNATRSNSIEAVIEQRLHWPPNTPQSEFIQKQWGFCPISLTQRIISQVVLDLLKLMRMLVFS